IKSNLGRLILKEEKEKGVHIRRKTQSLPDRTHMHSSLSASTSKSPSRSVLARMQSAEFSTDGDKGQPGGARYIYIYICVCVCVCIYIYIYTYIIPVLSELTHTPFHTKKAIVLSISLNLLEKCF
ncbi:hypothetical protein XENORESO_001478, partial [Xenotaenia resolanae]